ncbi:cellular tumor antigen p53 isoform X2 [Parasteatoda tepidariorum]|uniref:cellular tumor antigen p53 isoform X2 n=1 Tax=Parasteatoda tepidariorum TaxID=114398 RepID=UPI0039BCA10D
MMSADDSVQEVGSSQELPLSQETFLYGWNNIPAVLRDMLCSENQNNASLPLSTIPASSLVPQSSLPSTEDLPGFFNFTVTVPVNEAVASKNSTFVYSSMLKRLYVRLDSPCPFNFSVNQHIGALVQPSFVRATLFYCSPENINYAVKRCCNHRRPDSEKGDLLCEHILRSEGQGAKYFKDSVTGRCSVLVPLEKPPMGQDFSTYLYKFLCYTSCTGGPNRRPMSVVFTLENMCEIMGRRKIDVRVCSCPLRDKTLDENRFANENTTDNAISPMIRDMPISSDSSLSDITNDCKRATKSAKRKKEEDSSSGEEKEFIIKVRSEECYRFLKGLKTWFDIMQNCKTMKNNNWVPTVIDARNLLNALTSNSESDEK